MIAHLHISGIEKEKAGVPHSPLFQHVNTAWSFPGEWVSCSWVRRPWALRLRPES
jgi:hypothetical protein